MDRSRENRDTLEQIKREVACESDYACCRSEREAEGKVVHLEASGLIECLSPASRTCHRAVSFGNAKFCTCPVRAHLTVRETGS